MEEQNAKAEALELEQAYGRNIPEYREAHIELLAHENATMIRLPDDILFSIFDLCNQATYLPLHDKASPLWSLSHTCQRWRTVALSYPLLWRIVRVDIAEEPLPKDVVSMVKTWIERSQSVPLRCDICFGAGTDVLPKTNVDHEVLEILLDECHRWLDVYLNLDERTDLYYWLAQRGGKFQLLRDLEVVFGTPRGSDSKSWPPLGAGFSIAPNLVKGSISNFTELYLSKRVLPTIPLPWHRLTHYSCIYYADPEFFGIASQLHNLEILKLSVEYDYESVSGARSLTLPRLRSLEWKFGGVEELVTLLNYLTLPALVELLLPTRYFIFSDTSCVALLEAIDSLHRRSSCQIQQLRLDIAALISPHTVLDAVHTFHFQVEYTEDKDIDDLLRKVLDALQSKPVLRRLTTLRIYVTGTETFTDGGFQMVPIEAEDEFFPSIVDMIAVRRSKNSPHYTQLNAVAIQFDGYGRRKFPGDLPAYQRLLRMRDEGLVLSGSAFDWY
ncbi:hypothetical protein V5O48_017475 [Marasmius crinis-equi]|uniref:F-box domain-containing protein n=1 Tax=Marasmius crinis-equi TaxID=585013 RepID=A0ABR3ENU9_9AGAR